MGSSSSTTKSKRQHVLPAKPQQQVDSIINDRTLCQKHAGKLLTKYCEKENRLYCDACLLARRASISTESQRQQMDITDFVKTIKFKQKKIKVENSVRSKKRDTNSLLTDVNDNITTLNTQKCNLIEEINNFRKAVLDILNHLCDELCDNVTRVCDIERNSLEKREKTFSEYLQKLATNQDEDIHMQEKDVLKLIHVLEMEKVLSVLEKQNTDNSFVDVQLKLHDNISLRHLLQCDQVSSTLGEVVVLRNIKSARPCTKDLIIHDISEVEESDEEEESNIYKKVASPQPVKVAESNVVNRRSSLRSTTPRQQQIARTDIENVHNNEAGQENRSRWTPEPTAKEDNMDDRAPLRSVTPRAAVKRKTPAENKHLNDTEAKRRSTSRMSQSVKSNFSIMTPSAIQFGTPVNEKKFFERSAALIKSISLPVTNNTSDITSSVLLPNGNVILCDRSNRKLWYFDPTFSHLSDMKLEDEPHNMCIINDSTIDDDFSYKVAVTFPRAKTIQILNASCDDIIKVDEVRTEPECWGIGCKGKSLVFSTEKGAIFRDVGDYRNYRWRKYKYTFQTPISLIVNQDLVYVCNWGLEEVPGNMVVMFFDDRRKNQIKFPYSNRSLQRPISCTVDGEGNVYICDAESPGIHQVSCDGSQYRVLNINGGQSGSWQHINFVPGSDYFILTEAGSNLLYVFQMK